MIKIKVLNHQHKTVIIEVDESVYAEIEKIIISKYATKLHHIELLEALSIPLSKLVNDFNLITEQIVNDAVNNTIKK